MKAGKWKVALLRALALVAFLLPSLHVSAVFMWSYYDGDFCIPVGRFGGYSYKIGGSFCQFDWGDLFLFSVIMSFWLPLILVGICALYRLRKLNKRSGNYD